jgi:hypothetical protein
MDMSFRPYHIPTINANTMLTKREIKSKKKKMRMKRSANPYLSRNTLSFAMERGRKEKRMCEPSKGGMGRILKTVKRRLMYTIDWKMRGRLGWMSAMGRNLRANPKTKAKARLEAGPAKLTFADPNFWSRKRWRLTGTGFAHPKRMPPPEI